ncbi:ATP-binding protein [Variovorax paradoxus]|uniref:ATP-binding protein n=1 Tax=Variovorax paradoxus TaxID=34073 RepID=UPI0005ACA3D5|nr:winged helix-turn-helix domain-containing protein [Variovorax paradoxus]
MQEHPPLAPAEVHWYFGPFKLWETQRRLERGGQLVKLGGRSFDLLLQLVKRAGECLGKDELLAAVWAGVLVEEASVRVHMSLLRKALGEPAPDEGCKEWISNIPLRGYRFNGRVRYEALDTSALPAPPAARASPFTKPPARLIQLVGRDAEVERVLSLLEDHRLVTLAGPGGIGKTSVAIRAAECLHHAQGVQVAFVDLAPLISQDHVTGTLARAVGVAADMPDTLQAITQCLHGQDVLLLVDNCEHMLDVLPQPIAGLLAALPRLRVLATSREVVRVTGEFVMRLPALAFPEAEPLTLEEAMDWPAVKLLVARARDAGAGTFKESHGALLARISQQVDGIPLAIELVAARLGVQSVNDLALLLNDHMRLYAIGQRAVHERHRTLAAALDWSVALLDEDELRMFRRLSVFRGRFDVDSAVGLCADMDGELAFNALISLANKSLIFFDSTDSVAPYRMLDTTRSYAASLLAQAGERESALRRHLQLMLGLMKTATSELPTLTEQSWVARYAYRLNDVRFALKACLTELDDAGAAAALIVASASLWYQVSEVEEYRDGIIATLTMIEQQPTPDLETATRLHTGLLSALLHTGGSNEEFDAASERALAGALAVGVPALELQARWGHCTVHIFRGNYLAALRHSQTLQEVVQSWMNPAAEILAHRVSAMTNHFCGRFETSRQHSEAAIAVSRAAGRTHANIGSDSVVAVKALFCRTLWIQGETTSALRMATEAVTRAEEVGDAISLCAALFGACPVALWAGEYEIADRWSRMMLHEAKRRGLRGWLGHAEYFIQGLRLHLERDPIVHVRAVAAQLSSYDAQRKEMLLTFCPDWLDDALFARIERGEGLWCEPEVRRAAGLRHERHGDTAKATKAYQRAIEVARQRGAVAWELRAVLSQARLWTGAGREQEAAELLDASIGRAPVDDANSTLNEARSLRERLMRG